MAQPNRSTYKLIVIPFTIINEDHTMQSEMRYVFYCSCFRSESDKRELREHSHELAWWYSHNTSIGHLHLNCMTSWLTNNCDRVIHSCLMSVVDTVYVVCTCCEYLTDMFDSFDSWRVNSVYLRRVTCWYATFGRTSCCSV